jgi:hypothetical protein
MRGDRMAGGIPLTAIMDKNEEKARVPRLVGVASGR